MEKTVSKITEAMISEPRTDRWQIYYNRSDNSGHDEDAKLKIESAKFKRGDS